MRKILVDHAAGRVDLGRSRPLAVPFDDLLLEHQGRFLHSTALDEALGELEAVDPRGHQILVLRYFSGMDFREIARYFHVSYEHVARTYHHAKLWLRRNFDQCSINY
jgi:RNA polymerase sigma factor (sigma-70 family)